MTRLNAIDERCEALFASALQRSDDLTGEAISEAISRTVQRLGSSGCASRMAQEFGDHPEAACERMRWARQILGYLPSGPPAPTSPAPTGAAPASPAPASAAPAATSVSNIRRAA